MLNYNELLNIDDFQKRETFKEERGEIRFYCKDCEDFVEAIQTDEKKYTYICPKCNGKNIAIGTHEGIKENYKIKK